VTPDLSVGGSNIEFVEKWPHLGHMISLTLSDDDDVSLRRQSLIGQFNTVLCRFGRLDPTVKNRIFQAYCSSHYGSELWNLDCDKITEYCSTWRKGLRRITFAFELILLKVGILHTPDCELTRAQIDCMLTAVGARDFL